MANVGVLDIQGGVIEHVNHIKSLGHTPIRIKDSIDLNNIDCLIIPGGESTTMGKILKSTGMLDVLREKIKSGLNTWGTCAGLILLAKHIYDDNMIHLGIMNIHVKRNAYGSQIDSFSTFETLEEVSPHPLELIFIRAPYITKLSNKATSLCTINGNIVAAKENNILVTSFHPELTKDNSFHKYFIEKFNKVNL